MQLPNNYEYEPHRFTAYSVQVEIPYSKLEHLVAIPYDELQKSYVQESLECT